MRGEERFCTNCRAPLPARATWCEKCGTDVGDVFDGRYRGQAKRGRNTPLKIVLALIIVGAVAFFLFRDVIPAKYLRSSMNFDTGPIRVVSHRPGGSSRAAGAALSQPEAVRALREYLVSRTDQPIKSECLAVASRGFSGGAYLLDAVDSCHRATLGRWKVDGKSGVVTQ